MGALGLLFEPHWALRAVLVLPALLLAPGLGWSRWMNRGESSALQVGLDAAWLSILWAVPSVLVASLAGGSPWMLWIMAVLGAGPGLWLGWHAPPLERLRTRGLAALAALALGLGLWSTAHLPELGRPLQDWWWSAKVDSLPKQAVGWSSPQATDLGWPEAGAGRLDLTPKGDVRVSTQSLEILSEGQILLLLQGPVGSALQVRQSGAWSAAERISADVVVDQDEGAVPRYLDHGIVALRTTVTPGTLSLRVESASPTQVFVLPSSAAPWSLDQAGSLRFAHYYQLLNLVENQRWAQELLTGERRLTIHQPPLWSYVLAVSSAAVSPDLPGAAALLILVLMLLGASAIRLLERLSPSAPWPAWLLPAVGVLVHAELMLQPGSVNFPDSLYAAALIAGLSALRSDSTARFVLLALIAGLLRYPGVVVLLMAAGLHAWMFSDGRIRARLGPLAAGVATIAALFGLAALLSQQLQDWLFILWFETVPEHFANNPEAPPIWQRPAAFYWTWLRYSGFGLLAALPLRTRGSRWVMATALATSLLLAFIDHFPTHYFLPLLAMGGVGVASSCAGLPKRWQGWLLSGGAVLAGLIFVWIGQA
ncbi:MAG: hypothetical protein ACI9VR_000354 [Cognaticolwellia sp.]|jgi:hypothetical protein